MRKFKFWVIAVITVLLCSATSACAQNQYILIKDSIKLLSNGDYIKYVYLQDMISDTVLRFYAESASPDILILADVGDEIAFDENGWFKYIRPPYAQLSKKKNNLRIIRCKVNPHFVKIKEEGNHVGRYVVDYMEKLILLETGETTWLDSRETEKELWQKVQNGAKVKIKRTKTPDGGKRLFVVK